MSDDMEHPSFTTWFLAFVGIESGMALWFLGVQRMNRPPFWQLIVAMALAAILYVTVYQWRCWKWRKLRDQRQSDERVRALAKAAAEEAQGAAAHQEALDAEIRQEKRALDECISCEGPLCTTGALEWRSRHKAAKREMWDLDGKPVHRDCFNRAKGHFPVPGVDRLAFPPRSFAKEAAAEAAAKMREYEENKSKLIEALKSQDPEVLEMERRNDLEDPLTREAMETIKLKGRKS